MEMVWEYTDPQEMSLVARELPSVQLGRLGRWLPNRTRLGSRYRYFKRDTGRRRAAPFRAWDTPAIPVQRRAGEEVEGSLPPISAILPLLEEESQLLDEARARGDNDAVEAVFDGDIRAVSDAVKQRVALAQGQAITHGKVTIGTQAAPENRLQMEVDFELPTGHYLNAAVAFDSDPGADILGQLRDFVAQWVETNDGERPGVMLGSTAIQNAFLANDAMKALVGTILGVPDALTIEQVNRILVSRQLPVFEVEDTQVMDAMGVTRRLIDEDRLVLLPAPGNPVGETQWGTTEEAKKLVRARVFDPADAPGLVVVNMESENPVQTFTLGTAIVLPVVNEPGKILSVSVLT